MPRTPLPILLPLAAILIAGCASTPPPAPPPIIQSPPPASPSVRGGENGLELQWLVIDDPAALLGPSLAPYTDRPPPIDARLRDRWRTSGLRIIRIPLSDLDTWRARLREASAAAEFDRLRAQGAPADKLQKDFQARDPFIGPENHQWLGQVPAWTDAVRGPAIDSTERFTVDGGPAYFGSGRFRLLVRCWTVPLAAENDGVRAGLHIEMVPQFQPQRSREDRFRQSIGVAKPPTVDEDGTLLTDLAVSLTVTEGDAYLIVPESPGADWAAPDPGRPASTTKGPLAPLPPTLGDALLTRTGVGGGGVPDPSERWPKAVVVLIPRVPPRYDLLGL